MASPLGLEPRISDAVNRQQIHYAQLVYDLVRLLGVENLLARPTPVEHFVVAALVACFAYSRRATAGAHHAPRDGLNSAAGHGVRSFGSGARPMAARRMADQRPAYGPDPDYFSAVRSAQTLHLMPSASGPL